MTWLLLLMIVLPLLGLLTDLNGRELAHTLDVAKAVLRRAEEEPRASTAKSIPNP